MLAACRTTGTRLAAEARPSCPAEARTRDSHPPATAPDRLRPTFVPRAWRGARADCGLRDSAAASRRESTPCGLPATSCTNPARARRTGSSWRAPSGRVPRSGSGCRTAASSPYTGSASSRSRERTTGSGKQGSTGPWPPRTDNPPGDAPPDVHAAVRSRRGAHSRSGAGRNTTRPSVSCP